MSMTGTKRTRGRPTAPADERMSEIIRVRLTPELAMKLRRLGGIDWIRERIRRARGAHYP